ncbi:MAG: hypothetical protein HY874_02575 [Chloroflexi bacterium]|nr:hypothetical protein [Chloroflexota bacterium]
MAGDSRAAGVCARLHSPRYDGAPIITFNLKEMHTMGDKSPKNTAKGNKQKGQKKDAKSSKK